jgi:hypothetical protein
LRWKFWARGQDRRKTRLAGAGEPGAGSERDSGMNIIPYPGYGIALAHIYIYRGWIATHLYELLVIFFAP